MSASKNQDEMLQELSDQIDNQLVEWVTQHKMPPLNLAAVILARLTWMAKMSDCKDDFLSLLEAPRDILENEDNEKQIH
jgi:hypothetical protein